MKKEYDFSKAVRGRIDKSTATKERITIRLDKSVLDWFRARVNVTGGNYQSMINDALREAIRREESGEEASKLQQIEAILRQPAGVVLAREVQPRPTRATYRSSATGKFKVKESTIPYRGRATSTKKK